MRVLAVLQRWLFRLGHDDHLPIVLGQRRIFIVPTAAGLLFAIVLLVMLVGAINYSLSLGHALVFLLGGLGLVGMVHSFLNLHGLRLTPGRVQPVFAGDVASFALDVENVRPQARRALEFAFAGQAMVTLDLAPASRATVAVPFVTSRRGLIEPGRVTLTTRYPLGLFRAWSYPQPAWCCVVYPKPLRTPLPVATGGTPADDRHGTSGRDDFAGLRTREPGDPTRHVAWKAVARRSDDQELLVKQFSGALRDELWLDWERTPARLGIEERLSILAGWVLTADEQQARYGLILPGLRIDPGQGGVHRGSCLRALALHEQKQTRVGG
ncbi:DUF58 domain-containing protein [Accumulibacter sp.]|uniref:DUF58 domain-containing protein n=1 Tax=Accumulibacter sp. TaxID=2053492 RepID=UPI0025CD1E37|nr:DUF58 domain-containing protein [Accumulibacter sp.]MCM8596758.1 DUF58 domain-containing protein [Accumulibacter sp.]MCM8624708.1 DUF58 domain-containing protein [Accumulibacter sp.]MDS4050907.1 DUF58 domain-containing protein [Accumulibacter sp.]